MSDELYTVKEVSQILKVNVNYVYSLINNGLLPALRLGSLKIRHKSLEKFLETYDGYDLSDPQNVVKLSCVETQQKLNNGGDKPR